MSTQNQSVREFARQSYTLPQLQELFRALVAQGTFDITAIPTTGLTRAISVCDRTPNLSSVTRQNVVVSGCMDSSWRRDQELTKLGQLAFHRCGLANWVSDLAPTIGDQDWHRGLYSLLLHDKGHPGRFLELIDWRKPGMATSSHPNYHSYFPHQRFDGSTLLECEPEWLHNQHDGFALQLQGAVEAVLSGHWSWEEDRAKKMCGTSSLWWLDKENCAGGPISNYIALLVNMWKSVHVWENPEAGAWEDYVTMHWSSLALVYQSLRLLGLLLDKTGSFDCPVEFNGTAHKLNVSPQDVNEMAAHTWDSLLDLGARESHGRTADLAGLNAIVWEAVTGYQFLDPSIKAAVVANIRAELEGDIGHHRYHGDTWMGQFQARLERGYEMQWCHGNGGLSVWHWERFARTLKPKYLLEQVRYFNRYLETITADGLVPEAYRWVDGTWQEDRNTPLTWAMAWGVLAFAALKDSLERMESGRILQPGEGLLNSAAMGPVLVKRAA